MTALQALPARRIARAIADAAERWSDADFPPRVRALDPIVERIGYSLPVVEYALDKLFDSISFAALTAVIDGELGGFDALDGFVHRKNRPAARALPLGEVAIISSRTTIGVAIVPAVLALCAKNDATVKDREDHLVAAFFKTLEQEDDAFAKAARAEAWDSATQTPALTGYAAVVAFGSDKALGGIRARCAPGARFIGFGPKASAGYVTRAALRDETNAKAIAGGAARDLVLYDGEGCLSLNLLFVERGGDVTPQRFAELLAAAVERAAVEFPIGTRTPETDARLNGLRSLTAFRAAAGQGAAFSDETGSFLLALDPPQSQPPFFAPRALGIHTVDDPAQALTYLAQHGIGLEALAADGTSEVIANMAAAAGASRIARFGDLQAPLLAGNHGGRVRIGDFVAWITDET